MLHFGAVVYFFPRDKCPQKTIDMCSYSNIATMEFKSKTYFSCIWYWFYFVTIKRQVLLLTHPPALTSNKHSGRNHIQREVPICLPKGAKAKCLHTMLPHNFNGGTTLGIQACFTRSWLLAVWPQDKLLYWKCCPSITKLFGSVTVCRHCDVLQEFSLAQHLISNVCTFLLIIH